MGKVANDPGIPSATSAAPALGLRVREVLGAASLAGAQVLAGADGLDRIVRRLNVMEVPDILPWVKPHELLLTTGYPLRDAPDALAGLVAALDDRGLAALAIKLHRYLETIPPEMLAEADRRGFPIIQFPDTVGFDDVLNEVLSEMLHRQAAVLSRSEEVHRALVSVVLEGGGLDDLAAELARILRGAVQVTCPDGRVLARAGDEDGLEHRTVVPIVAGRVDHGRIVAVTKVTLTEADVHGLERAATVAALAITKQLAVAAVEDRYRADFLRDLLTGRVEGIPAAIGHARSLGWRIDRPLLVLVAEPDPDGPEPGDGPGLPAAPDRFAAAWQGAVRWHDPGAPVAAFHREVVIVLGVPADGDVNRLVADLERQVRDDGGGGRRSFSLGVSRPAAGPVELPTAYEQARKAVQIGRRLHGAGARTSFESLGVHRLLSLIPDAAELRDFVRETLGELARETAEAGDLRHTLAVLLDTNCNVAEAARRLHFHYNTLRYRIDKLERLVGPFTNEAARRLDLALALRVLELRDVGTVRQ
jgi:purine catabolism regulator